MGKWAEKAYDDELLTKVKRLFESVKGKACGGLTEDGQEFTYEEFVETLDDNDKYIKKLFEHLVQINIFRAGQEAANSQDRQRRRRLRTQGTPYSVTGSRNQNRHANISPYMETILARGFLDDTSATTQHSSLDSAGYGYLHNWFTPSGNVGESSSSSSSTAAAIEPSPMWSAYEEFDAERADLQPYPFTTAVSVAPALPPQPLSSALPRNPNEAPYSAPGPSALRRNRRLSLLSAIAATASDSSNGQGSTTAVTVDAWLLHVAGPGRLSIRLATRYYPHTRIYIYIYIYICIHSCIHICIHIDDKRGSRGAKCQCCRP
ncbi:hypothetical protein RI367_001844 [Sorochytrium milnesiophthora]